MFRAFSRVCQCHHLEVLERAAVNGQPYQRPVLVPSLQSGGAGVYVQQVQRAVVFHLQYVRVSAYEQLRRRGVYPRPYAGVVVAGVAADVFHQHVGVLAFPSQQFGIHQSQVAPVAVAAHRPEHAELGQAGRHLRRPYVAGVPYLVARLEVVQVLVVPVCVRVAYYAYPFHPAGVFGLNVRRRRRTFF